MTARYQEPGFWNLGHAGWREFQAARAELLRARAPRPTYKALLVRRYLLWRLGRSAYEPHETPPGVSELDETLLAALNSAGIAFGWQLVESLNPQVNGADVLRRRLEELRERGRIALNEHPDERLGKPESGELRDIRLSIDPPDTPRNSDEVTPELQPDGASGPRV